MNARRFLWLVLAMGVAAGLKVVLAEPAQNPAPAGIEAEPGVLSSSLGTGFTYQGQLKKSGTPCTGTCDFVFSLWDSSSGGVQAGSTQTLLAVVVTNAQFTAFAAGPRSGCTACWSGRILRGPSRQTRHRRWNQSRPRGSDRRPERFSHGSSALVHKALC